MNMSIKSIEPLSVGINENPRRSAISGQATAIKFILCMIFFSCALAIFLFGANYYHLFETNGNPFYAAGLSDLLLITALILRNNSKLNKYWYIIYTFFITSMVNLVSDLFSGYYVTFLHFINVSPESNQGISLGKLYEMLLVVIPILMLVLLSGADLRSLYLAKGKHTYKWGIGIGSLLLANYLSSVLIFFGTGFEFSELGSLILWGVIFAFSSSLLEEMWVRGLLLKKLIPLIVIPATIGFSSIWFAALHFLAVAYMSHAVIPIFVVNTFTMGLACGILMVKTESIGEPILYMLPRTCSCSLHYWHIIKREHGENTNNPYRQRFP
jgi:membrane protease YdiL (CAAX protease family)